MDNRRTPSIALLEASRRLFPAASLPVSPTPVVVSEAGTASHLLNAQPTHDCVAGYERIATTRGLIRLDSLQGNEDSVHAGSGETRHVLAKVKAGDSKVIRLVTRSGYQIDVSADQPILVSTTESFPHFALGADLTAEHFACICRDMLETDSEGELPPPTQTGLSSRTRPTVPAKMNVDLAWLLGVIVGDGSYRDQKDGTVDITNMDREVLDRTEAIFASYGLRPMRYQTKTRAVRLYVVSRAFRQWLLSLGLKYVKAQNKHVPVAVLNSTPACRGAFLQGLFDTDGSAGTNNCRFVTSSRDLGNDVQLLLLTLGIISIRRQQKAGHWCVSVSGTALSAFSQHVGFSIGYKRDRLRVLLERAGTLGKTNIDTIPNGEAVANTIREVIRDKVGRKIAIEPSLLLSRIIHSGNGRRRETTRLSYRHLSDLLYYSDSIGVTLPVDIADLARSNYYYDPIERRERLNESPEMYEIKAEDQPAFVVNGFVCGES